MKKLKCFIAVILLIIFTFSIVPKTLQNDTFYVIELGKQIEKTGIDWKDHYSIHKDLEYRYPHWAFDVINWKVFEIFGYDGIYVLTSIFASIFVLIVFWNLLSKKVNFNLAFIGSLVVSYLMKGGFTSRAQVVSYSLFLLEYIILESYVERPIYPKLLLLFFVSCLMANFHSTAWIMMLVLVLPFIGEKIVYFYSFKGISERLIKKYKKALKKAKKEGNIDKIHELENKINHEEKFEEENSKIDHKIIITKKSSITWILLAVIVLMLGALVTPLKSTPFLYFIKTSFGNSMNYINEHLPIIPAYSMEFIIYTIVIVALIGFTKVKLKLSDSFLILGLYLMTLSGRRNLYLLIALTSCVLIKLIDDFIKSNIKTENPKFAKRFFVIFSILTVIISSYEFYKKSKEVYVDEKIYPVKALGYIKNNLEDYKNLRIYNSYDYGSYMLMNGIPVFIDSRCDLYNPEFNKGVTVFEDYMKVYTGEKTISDIMDKYNLEYSIVPVDNIEYIYIKEDLRYTELYKDKYFAIYKYIGR